VLAGKLGEARVDKGWDMVPPTLDVPYEIRRSGLFVPFVLEEVRVVDMRSGEPVKIIRSKDEAVDSGVGPHLDKNNSAQTPVENDSVPVLVSKIEAIYPPLAKQARIQGLVKLKAVIGKGGSIQDLKAVSCHPLLVPAALEAVRQWLYKPAYKTGKPVPTQTTLEVSFSLP
jgi:TonB family protein